MQVAMFDAWSVAVHVTGEDASIGKVAGDDGVQETLGDISSASETVGATQLTVGWRLVISDGQLISGFPWSILTNRNMK